MRELTVQQARTVAVRAQRLDAAEPGAAASTDLLGLVHHLTRLPADLTRHICPSAEHIAWTRLRSPETPALLEQAMGDGQLVELFGDLVLAEDVALRTAEMQRWPDDEPMTEQSRDRVREWVETNDECRRDILDLVGREGPLATRDLPDTCVLPWASSGWTNGKNVRRLVGFMVRRGELALAAREGGEPLWDLAERVYPADPPVPAEQARALREQRRLRAIGIARPNPHRVAENPHRFGELGERVRVEGLRGFWQIDPEQLARLEEPLEPRAALLSPFDGLVMDRTRMAELFGSDYVLEMYLPEAKRRWGYFALPILFGTNLVGKLDARTDLDSGQLWVTAVHHDTEFTSAMTGAVDDEIEALAAMLGVSVRRATGASGASRRRH